jgi:hypothetical protein
MTTKQEPGTSTLVYADYEPDDLNAPVPVIGPENGPYNTTASVRLGPHHVPNSVTVEITSGNEVLLQFRYPNEEDPERDWRIPRGQALHFHLGKHSRKILEIKLENALEYLVNARIGFDPKVSIEWCQDLRPDRRFVCTRNAEVVSAILRQIPENIHSEILRVLRQAGNPKGSVRKP